MPIRYPSLALTLSIVAAAAAFMPSSAPLLAEQRTTIATIEPPIPLLASTPTADAPTSANPDAPSGQPPGDAAVETGTDPSKLLLRLELNPSYIALPDAGYLLTINVKLDVPLTKSFGVAVDVPVTHAGDFAGTMDDQVGLGDVAIRARHVWSFERSSLIAGAEAVLNTADDELLGTGKWQLNPSIAYVYYFTSEYLFATAWKQQLSIAGDDDRPHINQSDLRFIGIYIHPKGRWLLADYQPTIQWDNGGRVAHLFECEAGTMISRTVGISIRPGIGLGANRDRDWSIGVGLRIFF